MHKVITLPEGGRGVRILMAFCACKIVHLKEQTYLHPDGDLVGITYTPPHSNLGQLCDGVNCINLLLVTRIGCMIQISTTFIFQTPFESVCARGSEKVLLVAADSSTSAVQLHSLG